MKTKLKACFVSAFGTRSTVCVLFLVPSGVYNIEGLIQQSFYHVR